MSKNILTWISLRYFSSKKKTGLISFTSYVSIIGIALGAFALLVTLSVLNGFESEIARRVIDLESHLRLSGSELRADDITTLEHYFTERPGTDIQPFVLKKAILSTRGMDAVVRIKGIEADNLATLIREEAILRGANSFQSATTDLPGVVLGFRLADRLGLYLGDTLHVVNPLKIRNAFSIPYVGNFVLTGVFRLDLFDYDENLAFIDLTESQKIFRMPGQYSGIDIRFPDYAAVNQVIPQLQTELGERFNIASWEDLHRDLFGAMKLEKYGSFIALCFIILVAIFNLTSSLVMLVMEKIKEIGMLQTLGMNRAHICGIFLRLGFLTGSIGLFVGLLLALTICLLQQHWQFIPLPAVYFIPYLPVEVHLPDVIAIILAGCLFIYLATIYPSWRVGRLIPWEAIQYEK